MLLTGKVDVVIPEKLKKLFEDSPIVVNGPLTGNSIKEDDTLILGLQCGPTQALDALLHEMSHFVEIDEDRILVKSWGMRYTSIVEIGGREYEEPQTTRAIERECRVIAYQNHLKEYLGLPLDLEDDVVSLHFMLDWFLVPSGKFRTIDKVEKARRAWCVEKVKEYMLTHTLENFFEIWHHRNAILSKRKLQRKAA